HLVWAGDYRKARGELLRVERGAAPSDATRLALLAETHLNDEDPAGARKLLEEGLQEAGPEPRLLVLLAEAAERTGDLRAAADALGRARAVPRERPPLPRRRPVVVLVERLERLNASEGKPERTTRLHRRLRRRHPESAAVALLFARHLIAQGRLDDAEAALNALPAAAAGHPLVHVLWAEVHRQRGHTSLAAVSYATVLGPDPGLGAP